MRSGGRASRSGVSTLERVLSPSATLRRARNASAFDERQEILVDDLRMSGAHPVGIPFINLERPVFDQLDRQLGRVGDGDDLIVIAVKDQYRHSNFLQVFGEVGFRKR